MITYYKILDASAIAMSSNYKLDNQHWLMQSTLRAFRTHKRYIGKLLSWDIAQYYTTNLLAARHTLTGNQQIYMHSAYQNAQNQLLLARILKCIQSALVSVTISLFSAMLFDGGNNSIQLQKEYYHTYGCEFDLLYYPFDTQVNFEINYCK